MGVHGLYRVPVTRIEYFRPFHSIRTTVPYLQLVGFTFGFANTAALDCVLGCNIDRIRVSPLVMLSFVAGLSADLGTLLVRLWRCLSGRVTGVVYGAAMPGVMALFS